MTTRKAHEGVWDQDWGLKGNCLDLMTVNSCVHRAKYVTFVFQNGFVSAIPFLLSYIIGVGGGQVADKLRSRNILTTGEVRKVFASGGEFKWPFISLYKITHGGLREVICEQSLFCLKFRGEEHKEKPNTSKR